ncbi:hypothetical protein LTR85_011514 [Meristemomyces frigidus]|nr:hypothetical protein LTR85_011514 [Meristemomyces frigidus]
MFHSGDLNSGISLAIQQQKLVACFVRQDEDYWSQIWEDYWLANPSTQKESSEQGPSFGELLGEKAVLLRLDYGSKEASFLSAFCKIEKAPTFVVIRNGQVLEKLEGGVGQDEWIERVLKATGLYGGQEGGGAGEQEDDADGPGSQAYADSAAQVQPAPVVDTPPAADEPSEASAQPPSTTAPASQSSSTPSTLFPDRAQRLEAEKAKRDAAENADRQARQDARRQEAEDAYAADRGEGKGKGKQRASTSTEDADKQRARDQWIYQQKQRKDQAKKDRERILAQIEADKAERRVRRENGRMAEREAGAGASTPLSDERIAASRRSAGAGGVCSLQIRLFDGSSIRNRFPTDTTLANDVRSWIKETSPPGTGGADIPYTFRQILAPQPSRSIEISEEHQTLRDLELAPSATLVLVPVAGYTDAYASNGGSSSGVLGYGWGLANGVWSRLPNVGYYLPSFARLYMGGTGDPQEPSNVAGARMAGAGVTPTDEAAAGSTNVRRVKTLADQRAEAAKKDPEQFYNGNSLKFEERDDGK